LTSLGAVTVFRDESTAEIYYFSAPLVAKLSDLRLTEGSGFALYGIEETQGLEMLPESNFALDRHYRQQGFGWTS